MNRKERFLAINRFEETDHAYRFETMGFWPETIDRWHSEGLSKAIFNDIAAIPYFDLHFWLPLPFGMHDNPGVFPPFIPRVIDKMDNTRTVRDFSGKTYKEFMDGSASIPQHVDDPVHNYDDFRKIRWRFNPDFPGRVNNPVIDGAIAVSKMLQLPLAVQTCGLFGFHRHLLGVQRLMTAYFDMPDLVHSMSKCWLKLYKGIIRQVSRKTNVDMVLFWEDMCFKSGPLISPKTFKEFMTPYYRELIEDARDQGIEIFWVDTDGDCRLVIPLFKEVGVTGMYPFEVQAGMDVVEIRNEHPDLVIWGGIDKRKLALGKEDIEKEIERVLPEMLSHGGYLPCTDHLIPPDVSLGNFKYYMKILRERY